MTESNYNYRKPIDKSKISPQLFEVKKGFDYFWGEVRKGFPSKKNKQNTND